MSKSPKKNQPANAPQKPPKTLPYSDIELSNWRDYPDVETGSLWMFNSRDRQNGHQLDYHGNCVPQILTQLLTRYTKKDDVVLDLFLGSGTSAIEAANMGRREIGVELKPEMAEYVREKLKEQGKDDLVEVINGDSANHGWTGKAIRRSLKKFTQDQAQFLFLHPPYADIIKFSEAEADLSNTGSTEAFLDQFEEVCRLGYEFLEPGRYAALVIGDKYTDGEWIPLGFYCMDRMNRAGFTTKSIIVKNVSGNEKAKGRTSNLWRYRALAGGFYIFKHEYVMIFEKRPSKRKSSK
ncbi:MAG: site-specific DNA-methyltransferase [Vampirovibrio sp.]|nr:site-specific DNA-methyltransferase [Vampirovibrio sp.]